MRKSGICAVTVAAMIVLAVPAFAQSRPSDIYSDSGNVCRW